MAYGTVNADVIGTSVSGSNLGAGNASAMKNRIINGAMVIDQRNAGASGTAGGYTVDRWGFYGTQSSKLTWQQNAGSVTPPAGFVNYLGFTSSSAYSVISSDFFECYQMIEGVNVADLGWGTANAKTVTLSFQVRSSLTGSFGGFICNSDASRIYPFSYTISSANTWTTISVTIAGDTSGTWLTNTNSGIQIAFGLGAGSNFNATAGAWTGTANNYIPTGSVSVVGTNGATWYVTGVQLEVGSSATGYEYRQYTTELQLCQRYYAVTATTLYGSISGASGQGTVNWFYKTTMRTAPTVTGNSAVTVVTSTADFAAGITNNTGGYYASFASGSTASAEL